MNRRSFMQLAGLFVAGCALAIQCAAKSPQYKHNPAWKDAPYEMVYYGGFEDGTMRASIMESESAAQCRLDGCVYDTGQYPARFRWDGNSFVRIEPFILTDE